MASVRSLNSRWLALSAAAAYLVISAAVGAALLSMSTTSRAASENPTTYLSGDQPGSSAKVLTGMSAPPGFLRVAGPIEMQTVIPDGWRVVAAGSPGAMRATDPSDAGRLVGYGGAEAVSQDIVEVHISYEDRFADRTTDYRRVSLNRATYGGHPAVEWEFLHNDGRGTQHVRALYWLVDDTEYFVFAAGPHAQWSRMEPIYAAMVANSRP